ncbi:hypothetical protein LUZ63_003011 [Rhynchospora breviuscula]|uniref:Protein kinase domain-containing protein n=1 Tax=Rhynchospora breviuscula TaxID=2022672 RepID=A0A9Q0CZT8_9POAL|nr:hypothetical protein LUZ63_003011 [Rhynchospora breviuscula]
MKAVQIYGGTNPLPHEHSGKKKMLIAIAVVVPLLIIVVAILTAWWIKRKKYNGENIGRTWQIVGEGFPKLESRQFSYNDLKKITNQFKTSIGTGGFGSVYLGLLEDGVQVAVKMHSNMSAQGVKELLAEAASLTRVHHKNLVSLMGYCIDENCMALVYEFMQGGNLHDKLTHNDRPLAWKQRLRIANESAQGLEYLHKACNPPLIHRDVKTTNILLTENLEAKLADFGLSRVFNNEAVVTHVSTRVVGTPGYLDPEYYLSNQLSTKSDVFSFGVVLLELITGRRPVVAGLDEGNLVQWVHQRLSEGDIKSIVDPKMQDGFDINSVWKVTNLACKCTEFTSSERPTMTAVVAELKESLDLESSATEMHTGATNSLITDVSHDSLEISFQSGMPAASGPSVR